MVCEMNRLAKKILVLGDIHLPFADWEALEQAREFAVKHKPDVVFTTGDLTDQKSWSRFMKEPHDDNPESEWNKTVAASKELAKMFPRLVIRRSNHDIRYIKKAAEAGIVKAMIRGLDELFPYKGWIWELGNDPYVLDDIAFMHGDELYGSVKVKVQQLGLNVVQGHTHKAEIVYNCTFNRRLWGMDVGCMIDTKSAAFDYAAKALSKVWVGHGWVQDGVPYLFPKKG
jgi:predicted phosphodiesterase